MNNFVHILENLSEAAVVIVDNAVCAYNNEAANSFTSEISPVFVPISDNEAEINGVLYRQRAALKGGAELYIAVGELQNGSYDPVLSNINTVLREELGVAQAALHLIHKELESGAIDGAVQNLKMIQKSQYRLNRLSDNINDILEPEDGLLRRETIDMREFCRNLCGSVSALLYDSSVTVTFFDRMEADDDAYTQADQSRLERMLLNLISNAVKYSNEREVKLILRRKNNRFTIDVINFAENYWPGTEDVLFKAYTTESASRYGGVGFGLSAAQHIAMLHGGSIVSSRNDGEIVFTVSIPQVESGAKFSDREDDSGNGAMRRLLTGLSDILGWDKFSAPFIEY